MRPAALDEEVCALEDVDALEQPVVGKVRGRAQRGLDQRRRQRSLPRPRDLDELRGVLLTRCRRRSLRSLSW